MTKLFYEKMSNAFLNWPGAGTIRMAFVLAVVSVLYVLGNFPNGPENY